MRDLESDAENLEAPNAHSLGYINYVRVYRSLRFKMYHMATRHWQTKKEKLKNHPFITSANFHPYVCVCSIYRAVYLIVCLCVFVLYMGVGLLKCML